MCLQIGFLYRGGRVFLVRTSYDHRRFCTYWVRISLKRDSYEGFCTFVFLYPVDVCIFKTSSARTCGDLVYMYLVGTRTVRTSQL